MRFPVLSLLFAAALCSCLNAEEPPQNQLTAEESAAGWTLLFDGKDASPWWRGFKRETLPDGWVVENGALVRKTGGGDIVTREEYDSYEFSIDWKISEGGNSGIIFKVQEDKPVKAPWMTGPEAQILDNAKGHDPQRAGWLYQLYPASVDTTKPAGEWNHFVLKIEKTPAGIYYGEHTMNGTKYVHYEIGSEDWKERVAKSKFKDYPDFGKAAAGRICLQDHGNVVSFRNIKIRVLK
jgi:hypothetical protein